MHVLVLVVGPDVDGQLRPYAEYEKVEPYRVYVDERERASMAEQLGVAATDDEALLAGMQTWCGRDGELHDGRLCFWTDENPSWKHDGYVVGGRFSGYLKLSPNRPPSFFGRHRRSEADEAAKAEVDVQKILEEPPFAVLADGVWHDQGWAEDGDPEAWRARVAELLEAVREDQRLTVVDAHC